jgi:hypothetical protein
MKVKMRRFLKGLAWVCGVAIALGAIMQIVPYGRTHANPPVIQEPEWDTPRTRELAVRACFDCHSNQTRWPWYADVAPLSWVVQSDVESARHVINFSEWNLPYDLAPYSSQSIITGAMPPAKYRMAHPEANLTRGEMLELVHGLDATFKSASTVGDVR